MSNYSKILSLLIFAVSIWSAHSLFYTKFSEDMENLKTSKQELLVKQSFNDNSPAALSNSINEFIPTKFDKNEITNAIDKFARESNVKIVSFDTQAGTVYSIKEPNNQNSVEDQPTQGDVEGAKPKVTNTLKAVDLSIKVKGDKKSFDNFLSKLANSKQYIDIQDINFSFDLTLGSSNQYVSDALISAKTYYKNL